MIIELNDDEAVLIRQALLFLAAKCYVCAPPEDSGPKAQEHRQRAMKAQQLRERLSGCEDHGILA